MTTLTQLSKHLQLSTSTISRVLNNDENLNISPETRNKIVEYAEQIGYIKKISKSKPNILLYYCNEKKEEDQNDPFFLEIKTAVIEYCKSQSINLLHYHRGEIPNTTVNINGIVAIGTFNGTETEMLQNYSNNITFINSFPDLKYFDSIVIDDQLAIEDLINLFIKDNINTIDFIGGHEYAPNEDTPRFNRRQNHFEYYSNICKLTTTSHIGNYSYKSGYSIATDIIKNKRLVPAYICASDSIAHGFLDALLDNNINVPGEVQVTGFNDDNFTNNTRLKISSMHIHKNHMARYAIDNVLARIMTPTSIHKRIVLPTTFYSKDTTKF